MSFEITKKKVPRKDVGTSRASSPCSCGRASRSWRRWRSSSRRPTQKMMREGPLRDDRGPSRRRHVRGAAAAHPEAFPPYYVGILESAEMTGNLDSALDQLADVHRPRHRGAVEVRLGAHLSGDRARACRSSSSCVLAVFVLPKFVVFFKSLNAKLPLPTRMLLSMSSFVSNWWWAIVILHHRRRRRSSSPCAGPPRDRSMLDAFMLKLPVLGDLIRGGDPRAGLPRPLLDDPGRRRPSTVAGGHRGRDQQRRLPRRDRAHPRADDGGQGARRAPRPRPGLFPAAARQMFRVGEETGTLDQQLEVAAQLLQPRARRDR